MDPLLILIVFGAVLGIFLILGLAASRYRKVGPNEALIIFGRPHVLRDERGQERRVGFRIVRGGGSVVWPVVEQAKTLSMETMTIDVSTPEVYTLQGVPIIVEGVAQIKVQSDEISIATAAEQFLSKTVDERKDVVKQTLEGHLRAIMGTMTVEEVYRNRETFAQQVQEVSSTDLSNMGFTVISFTIKDVHDKQGYLEALGKPRIAEVRRDASIAEAEADRDSQIKRAQAEQLGKIGEIEAQSKIAESQRDYNIKVAQYNALANQQKAEADLAYDLQKFKTEQLVKAEEIRVQIVQKEQESLVQEKEIARRERELAANVQKPADAERYRIQAIADADQYRVRAEAAAKSESTRLLGQGQADSERAQGLAQVDIERARGLTAADVIKAKGEAEAGAMANKAEAWHEYNEAAVIQMIVERMPELARAVAEPLAKTERIILIGQNGDGAGASKITRDITDIMAQMPAVVEALTGLKLQDVLKRIPALADLKVDESKSQAPTAGNGGRSS
ncbi:MAG: flotillin family protein [Chloroflexota bacterium]